jgi:hypothetical protein
MTRSAAERTSDSALRPTKLSRPSAGPPPDARVRSEQLPLIDVHGERGVGQEGLDLPQQIASMERELRYYRRVLPTLSRAGATPKRPSREHGGQPGDLARWLTDGQHVIDAISRTLGEQRELEMRLTALERAHGRLRDELAGLADDEPEERGSGPGVLGNGWVRAGLVALILVIVTIVSIPYFIDWWQALTPPRHG